MNNEQRRVDMFKVNGLKALNVGHRPTGWGHAI